MVSLPALDRPGVPLDELWDDWFTASSPAPDQLRRIVVQLHTRNRHDHVVAAIEAALIHGHAQPWMYEVLALSMRIVGRPREDVERVLLSQVDVINVDVPGMLFVAAYLTRINARGPALRMYRQVSKLEPTRPDPYLLGLKLARNLKDYDGLLWATTGILNTGWVKNHKARQQEADDAATDAIRELREQGRDEEADAFAAAIAEAHRRDLVIRLTWAGEGDLDLYVEEPEGTVCSCENPQTPAGGVLVHDGYGPDQDNCHEDYVAALAVAGTYRVRVKHVRGNIVGRRAVLEVLRYAGSDQATRKTFTVVFDEAEKVIRLSLQHGRRNKPADVSFNERARIQRNVRSRKTLMQMMGRIRGNRPDPAAEQAAAAFNESRERGSRIARQPGTPATGFQPVISVLSEGVSMSALALISGDRRYVRITTSPAITAITDVFTFSFQNSGGGNTGGNGNGNNGGNGNGAANGN